MEKQYHRDRSRAWYEKNKEIHREYSRTAAKKRRDWHRAIMKKQKCAHCGTDDYRVFEWHHLDPKEKDAHIARLMTTRGRDIILEEIKKCICLCANCHRIEHFKE